MISNNSAQKRPYASIAADNQTRKEEEKFSEHMSVQDKRLVTETLTKLMKHPCAGPFLQPVDPVFFNIPDYFDIIKHPMDLSTIQTKLNNYQSKEEFIADVELMLDNCYLYNNATDPVCDQARELEKAFKKHLAKKTVSEKQPSTVTTLLSESEYKHCASAIKEFKKPKYAHLTWPFERPVDAAAWGATDYYDIIQHPMDMSTIENKFKNAEYTNEDQFYDDYKLMFSNCYKYNPPHHEVHLLGKKFEEDFDKHWNKIHDKPKERAVKKQRVDQDVMITPPTTEDEVQVKQNTEDIINTDDATTKTTANDGRHVLRVKLNVKKSSNEAEEPPKQPITTPSKPAVKIPGLALSKEPPKLGLDHRPPSPQSEKKDQKPSIVLQNHDQWLAQARQHALQQKTSASVKNTSSTTSVNKPVQPNIPVNNKKPMVSKQPETQTPIFDIGELYNKINDEKRARQQQLREEQERREREERVRRERERKRYEEQMARKREFRQQMLKKKEMDRIQRMNALNQRVVDISAQKMSLHQFELNVLCKDLDWRELNNWQRETVDYRHIPVPAFVRRSPVNLKELRSKLLSKSVRLKHAKKQEDSLKDQQQVMNNQQDSDMDVE
ncbi:hypothetical protein G6F55_010383 [Rhizopus delemar]|uniref:Bromo domain-containing protein n=2 Tax=Rhizopus TaxID=4842 RepID=A0A9P6YUF0_9FUNG|nr:hypothetical protein G6F55_010383 [Rhizopus delemar]KAG1509319.1 hypothetical protein G6F52_011166 [Rhizopus delemar]KAG1537719.1 hypothetical protein G6F51_010203 [Rhizopus arrhizus]KAG1564488.1 hypothetical protein G6F50_010979 [Rhizopus delemar]KAG1623371.1 hypothetical protein G6F45_010962 [Rhizopus arrhizus]